jgi:AsmA family protein
MSTTWQRTPRPVRITGIVLLSLVLLIVLVLAFFDLNWLRGPLSRMASQRLKRSVEIDNLSGRLLSNTPTVTVKGLRIGNPDWAKASGDMLDVDGITVAIEFWPLLVGHQVLDQLSIDHPTVVLLRDKGNRDNWDFGDDQNKKKPPQKPGEPAQLPVIHLFTLDGGSLKLKDDARKLSFDATVNAAERSSNSSKQGFRLSGHGDFNGQPFEVSFGGSSLINVKLDQPYAYDAELKAPALQASAHGSIDKPFDMSHISSSVDFKGNNLAGLYYLTSLALPFTPPFHFSGDLRRDGMLFKLSKLEGTVGGSDIHGDVKVDASEVRPKLSAKLVSHRLDLADLAPSVGAGVENGDDNSDAARAKADTAPPKVAAPKLATDKLIPTYKFEFDRLRSMDADVTLRAESVKTQKMPITGVDLKLLVDNGILTLNPADFALPQGKFGGGAQINARDPKTPADMSLDIRLTDVDMSQFKGDKTPATDAPLAGPLLSRIKLEGHGNSIHDILSTSDGQIMAVIPHGEMREAFAEFTGINAARGLGLLLTGSQKKAEIHCGIFAFNIAQGRATAQPLVFDTDQTDVTGSGGFDFNSEDLDLRLTGKSKKIELIHVRAPIIVKGTFGKPSFGLDPKSLAAQGAVAAALGVVATPVASIAAFIDPGLGENADCAALLASESIETTKHPPPPDVTTHPQEQRQKEQQSQPQAPPLH